MFDKEPQPKELLLRAGDTQALIKPEQGGIVASFRVGGIDVFFPDQKITIANKEKRRGGNPILFPLGGKPPEGSEFEKLPQHGFGRDMAWEVVNRDEGKITMKLTSNEETHAKFPFEFEADLTITVSEGKLRYDLSITNNSDESMPLAPGFHPYFKVAREDKRNLGTNIKSFDAGTYEWGTSPSYEMPDKAEIRIQRKGTVTIRASDQLNVLKTWSEAGQDYFCFEPRMDDAAIADPDKRINIESGQTEHIWVEVEFEKT